MARSALAVALGLTPGEAVVPVEVFADPPPPFTRTFDQCIRAALGHRPEVKSVAKRVQMAEAGHDIARWAMVPDVVALASYQHSEGMGMFMPKDSFFVGGSLKWNFWQWGSTYYGIDEAGHRVKQARIGLRQLRDGIYLEVKKAFLDLRTAHQTLDVARRAVTQAQESLRLERIRFEAHTATSTNVLDAQTAMTRTRLGYTSALYGWYTARAALLKATGGWGQTRVTISPKTPSHQTTDSSAQAAALSRRFSTTEDQR